VGRDVGMNNTINMYMDESCHTKYDMTNVMSLVTVYSNRSNLLYFEEEIKKIKLKYNIFGEAKWNKVSPSNLSFYKELIELISKNARRNIIRIRALLISIDKAKIRTEYSVWYYKMVYILFEKIIYKDFSEEDKYSNFNLFLDKKDIDSNKKTIETAQFLSNKVFNKKTVRGFAVDSKEYCLIQIADVIAGALTYNKRALGTSEAKIELIDYIEKEFIIKLDQTTSLNKLDFNLLVWTGSY